MKQQELEKMAQEKQKLYIQEMEKYIGLLEEENDQQKQIIEYLKEQNRVIEKNYKKYVDLVHKMMAELS